MGSSDEEPPTESRQEVLRKKLIKLFQQGTLVPPEDMPAFGLGVIKGFFKDGLGGTIGGIWGLVKLGWRYSPIGLAIRWAQGDRFEAEAEMIRSAADLARRLGQQAVNLRNSVQKEVMEVFQALLEGDRDKLDQKLRQLSEGARLTLDIASDVMTELAIAAIDLDPETKGRIFGWVLYQVAETVGTAGAAKAIEAGALVKLLSNLPKGLQDAKIGAALEKAALTVEKALKARPDLTKVPHLKGGAFNRWFNELTPRELEQVWSSPTLREVVEHRLRSPGGFHEWLPVSRARKFKEWGVSAEQIRDLRTPTGEVHFKPSGKHGREYSTTAHNQLFKLIDESPDYPTYVRKLQHWAEEHLVGGAQSLPPSLRPQ